MKGANQSSPENPESKMSHRINELIQNSALRKQKDEPTPDMKPQKTMVSSKTISDPNKQNAESTQGKTKPTSTKIKGFDAKGTKTETSFTQIYKNFVKPQRVSKSPVRGVKNSEGVKLIDKYFPGHDNTKGEEIDRPLKVSQVKTTKARHSNTEGTQTEYSFQRFCDKKDKFLYLLDDSKLNVPYDETDVFEFLMLMNTYYEQKVLNGNP
jgi:hypothetical protein